MTETFPPLKTIEAVDEWIKDHSLAFLYISQPNCSVCHGLLPQVEDILKDYPKIQAAQINTEDIPAIAGKLSVFTVPVLLLFVEGKEYIREARIVHLDLFREKIDKIYEHFA